ncbi:UNVERIFIED_ORG: hypothetical protein ABIC54_006405 [Burkholderia sp. 1263]
MAGLEIEYRRFLRATDTLLDLYARIAGLDIPFQKLIAENIHLRLFYELDKAVGEVALRMMRGATYLDGSSPTLLVPAFSSANAAGAAIIAKSRRRLYYLEWTTLTKIQSNLDTLLDPADHFLATFGLHITVYDDIRIVRNHIAHNTDSTRRQFSTITSRLFPLARGISPAKLLISRRTVLPSSTTSGIGNFTACEQYIKWARLFLKVLTKSPT